MKRKQTKHKEEKDKQRKKKKRQCFFHSVAGNMPNSTQRMRYTEGLSDDVLVFKKDFSVMKNNPIDPQPRHHVTNHFLASVISQPPSMCLQKQGGAAPWMHISTHSYVDQTYIWLETWYLESSLHPRAETGSVCLPQARWRAPGPQEPLLLPCPTLLSAAGVPQPADRGPPGAEAQRGAVA